MPYSASVPDAVKIDRVIAWLREEGSARPALILAYLHGPDAAGHASGPASPSALEQARRGDLLIGRLLRSIGGIDRRIAVLAVSDHGMSRATTAIRLDRLLTGAARGARAVSSGGTSNLYCGSDPAACSAAASILERIPGVTAYRRDDLPADLRCRLTSRTGDLVAIASPGSYFAGGEPRRGPPRAACTAIVPTSRRCGDLLRVGSGDQAGSHDDLSARSTSSRSFAGSWDRGAGGDRRQGARGSAGDGHSGAEVGAQPPDPDPRRPEEGAAQGVSLLDLLQDQIVAPRECVDRLHRHRLRSDGS